MLGRREKTKEETAHTTRLMTPKGPAVFFQILGRRERTKEEKSIWDDEPMGFSPWASAHAL